MMHLEVSVIMLVISCFSGGSFSDVETARVVLRDGEGVERCWVELGALGNATSVLVGMFVRRDDGMWYFECIEAPSGGRNFEQAAPVMREFLGTVIDPMMMAEGMHIPGKSFKMDKGDIFELPGDKIKVGLGWDTDTDGIDLDASVLTFSGQCHLETIYFNNKKSKSKAIVHHGDNLTGIGSGDDEVISINLNKIDPSVTALILVVNIYTLGKNFGQVKNAYFRIKAHKHEICRYHLHEGNGGTSNGMVMAKIYRFRDDWLVLALGDPMISRVASTMVDPLIHLGYLADFNLEAREEELKAKEAELPITWTLTVVKGKDLISMDKNGFSDPYFKYTGLNGKKVKSEIIKKTLNPEWNHTNEMIVTRASKKSTILNPSIIIELWDWDRIGHNDFMGEVKVNFNAIIKEQGTETNAEKWITVTSRPHKNDEVSGQVLVSISKQ